MKLRQAKALLVFDHHQRGIRYVHPHFDYRRRDQQLDLGTRERIHDGGFFRRRQTPMHQPYAQLRQRGYKRLVGLHRRLQLQRLAFFNQRTHPIHLSPGQCRFAHAGDHLFPTVIGD